MTTSVVCILLGAAASAPAIPGGSSSKDTRPPNKVADVFDHAASAVVKLYGGGVGREHGYGSGVLVSPEGKIVTSLSLLVSSRSIRVVLHDGRKYEARLVRSDERRQLALLQIDGHDLPFLSPAESAHLEPGDPVLALGNWFKIADGDEAVSISRGVVSLKTHLAARRLAQEFEYQGPIILYDAITANPGAAGGPLLDLEGRFVGVIGRIVESSGTNTRVNYALPIEEVVVFLGDKGPTSRPAGDREPPSDRAKAYLGIKLSKMGYRHVAAYVQHVVPGSPGAAGGVQADDLIVAIDGQRIGDTADYDRTIASLMPGQHVQFVIKRGNEVVSKDVVVGAKP